MFTRIWEFRCRDDKAVEFRAAYGADGAWARLFRRGAGYLGTELLESTVDPARHITIDRWESAAAWQAFLAAWRDDYAALDRASAELTVDEADLGEFHSSDR